MPCRGSLGWVRLLRGCYNLPMLLLRGGCCCWDAGDQTRAAEKFICMAWHVSPQHDVDLPSEACRISSTSSQNIKPQSLFETASGHTRAWTVTTSSPTAPQAAPVPCALLCYGVLWCAYAELQHQT